MYKRPSVYTALPAGVKNQPRTLTPKIAYYIGSGLAKLLADRFSKPIDQLKVSVSLCATLLLPTQHISNLVVSQLGYSRMYAKFTQTIY